MYVFVTSIVQVENPKITQRLLKKNLLIKNKCLGKTSKQNKLLTPLKWTIVNNNLLYLHLNILFRPPKKDRNIFT